MIHHIPFKSNASTELVNVTDPVRQYVKESGVKRRVNALCIPHIQLRELPKLSFRPLVAA